MVFDLDDTLYLERDYVASGFRFIADMVSNDSLNPLDRTSSVTSHEIYRFMWGRFQRGVRLDHFDALLKRFPQIGRSWTVEELVAQYRGHPPRLQMIEGMAEMIHNLRRRGLKTAIISDGPLTSQHAKAKALELGHYADLVVLTDLWGADYWKPHPRAFALVEQSVELDPARLVYVGDNPAKDFNAPIARGWDCIRVRFPGQLHERIESPPQLRLKEAASVHQLARLLLGGQRTSTSASWGSGANGTASAA
ncbi:MAG: HAD family hydrolase [Bifidobacteriaceae bacterium]|nr:HAD family hydrolase [Bifidobacteriaceae bacterium]